MENISIMKKTLFTLQLISTLKFFIIAALLYPVQTQLTIYFVFGTANILLYGFELDLLRKLKAANTSNPNS